jgi:hypothetical protein
VIEMPTGEVLLIDGGENQMFARYLAARFSGTSLEKPKEIDCIIVTHGDADHFEGLPKILESETNSNPRNRLFIKPLRVFHNGIVKGPSKVNKKEVPDVKLLGKTVTSNSKLFLSGLHDDLLKVPKEELNQPFKKWISALEEYSNFHGPILIERLDHKSTNAFNFLKKIQVEVLGPITKKLDGETVLPFLRTPPKSAAKSITDETSGSYSASHTINGHSVILRITYGNVRFLFSGDLNEEAEKILVRQSQNGQGDLRSEILKVPHHGSGDFSNEFLEAVKPMVSIVSSGDETEQKEYIHPRATLMGALGKHSSTDRPLIFVTEMVAFMKKEGRAKLIDGKNQKEFFAFSRSAFGIVHVRTDGKRLLVFTHSGKNDLKEAYAFSLSGNNVDPERKPVVAI